MMAMYFRGKGYDAAEDRNRPLDRKVLAVLWTFADPFKGLLGVSLVVMLLGMAAELARPYLLKVAIDEKILMHDVTGLMNIASIYAFSIAISAVASFLQTLLLQYVGQRIIYDVRQKVFRCLMFQEYTDIEAQPVGRMVTRVTNDTDAIKDLYTDVLVSFAGDVLSLLGIVVVMLVMDWQLALVSFIVIPLMYMLAAFYQKYARYAYRLVREKTAGVNVFLQESMNGISVIKAFGRFCRTEDEFRTVSRDYLSAGLREMRTFAVFRPLVDLIYTVAMLLVLWYGGWQSTYSGLEVGVIIAFLRYVERFFGPIKDLAEKYNLLQSALAAAERVYDMLIMKPPIKKQFSPGTDDHFMGHIVFEDVWFAYEGTDWVLKGVTFEIQAGQFVGVVGLSGSGKTTLISLLTRLYQAQRGIIKLDGVDIRDISLPLLRRRIGVVFQDVHLFKGTVGENISLYNVRVPQEVVVSAAKTANAHDFVMNLPAAYDTPVGYQGATLSAGQRQLLSLARALVHQPDILVLDEATSNIDSETEGLIQNALEKISKERTMLVVAHRLSTIQRADVIVVLQQGRVAEQGTHSELMACNGIYYRLYNSQ